MKKNYITLLSAAFPYIGLPLYFANKEEKKLAKQILQATILGFILEVLIGYLIKYFV
ncbi:MAG: hypothetical protein PHD02_00570 [Bacilli bacterium]|nr:hypothetical protein [Bacilli bacterium]